MDGLDSPPSGMFAKLKKNISGNDKEQSLEKENAILPIEMGYLTPRMMYELKHVLNETEENKANGLKALKELIEKEEKLFCRPGDDFLLQFLRARKYDVKKAFKLLQNYYNFRNEFSDIYDVSEATSVAVSELILRGFLGFLRERSRYGCAVLIGKVGMWDPEVDPFDNLFRAITACLAYAVEEPATQVCGFSAIFDLRELSWKQMKYCTPYNIYLLIRSTQFCFPGRYKHIHILSENKLFNLAWSTAHTFLTHKLRNRVHLHGKDLSGLLKYFHPSVLPVEFGGEHAAFETKSWKTVILEQQKVVVGWLKYGYQ